MSLFACFGGRNKREPRRAFDYWDCSNLGLSDLPKEVLHHRRTLKQLTLTCNNIRDVPKTIFLLEQLTELDLSENVILFLPPAIHSLRWLTTLNISKNSLSTIPDSIRECQDLIHLDVSANSLGTLPEGLTELRQLRTLCLNDCQLEELPPNIGKLNKLEVLELRENVINTLPQSICHLVLLERLDLGVNEIESLMGVVGTLESLAELWLDGNLLNSLPDEIGSLRNLKFLEVSENQLMFLPLSISSLVSLQDLHLSDNLLTVLPDTMGELRNLKMLKVERNRLTALPPTMDGWTDLVELSVAQNFLEEVPVAIGALHHLENLNLDENSLFSVPRELGALSQLNILSLRANNLTELPSEIGGLTNLIVLNVVGNRLQFLPFSLTSLDNLTAVWIAENQNRPLLDLQLTRSGEGEKMLTCILLPQQPADSPISSESGSPPTDRKPHPTLVNFDPKVQDNKSKLTRDPTPYPKELHIKALQWRSAREAAASGTSPDQSGATSDVPLRNGSRTRSVHRPYSFIKALSDPIDPAELAAMGNTSRPGSRRKDHSRERREYSRSPCTTPGPTTPVIREQPELERRRERPRSGSYCSSPSPPPLSLPAFVPLGHKQEEEERLIHHHQWNGGTTRGVVSAGSQPYALPPSPTLASPGDDLNSALITNCSGNNNNNNNNNNSNGGNIILPASVISRRVASKSSTYPLTQASFHPPPPSSSSSSAHKKSHYVTTSGAQGQSEASTLSCSDAPDPRSSYSMESGFEADMELDQNPKWYISNLLPEATAPRGSQRPRHASESSNRPYVNVPAAPSQQQTRVLSDSDYDHLIHNTRGPAHHVHNRSISPLTNRGAPLVSAQTVVCHPKGSRSFDNAEIEGQSAQPHSRGERSQSPCPLLPSEGSKQSPLQQDVCDELAQSSRRPHSPLSATISPSTVTSANRQASVGVAGRRRGSEGEGGGGGGQAIHQRYPSDSYYISDDSQGRVGAESSGQATPKNPSKAYGVSALGTSQDSGCDSMPNSGAIIRVELERNPSLGLGIREGTMEHDGTVKQGYHVYKIVQGSPAEQCGKIKLGDRIVEINGVDVTSLDLPDILALLSLERDATIKLTLYRETSMTLL